MNAPAAFEVHLVPGVLGEWTAYSWQAQALWLPRLGPTSFALLRHFTGHHDGAFVLTELGEAIGTSPSRAFASIQRLERFRVLEPTFPVEGKPVWTLRYTLPPLTPREWDRLPLSVRDRHAALKPVLGVGARLTAPTAPA